MKSIYKDHEYPNYSFGIVGTFENYTNCRLELERTNKSWTPETIGYWRRIIDYLTGCISVRKVSIEEKNKERSGGPGYLIFYYPIFQETRKNADISS